MTPDTLSDKIKNNIPNWNIRAAYPTIKAEDVRQAVLKLKDRLNSVCQLHKIKGDEVFVRMTEEINEIFGTQLSSPTETEEKEQK